MRFTAWVVAAAATVLVGATPAHGLEFEFSALGKFRASSTAIGGVAPVPAVNLGHCCALCMASELCAAVNYLASTRLCEMVAAQGLTWTTDGTSLLMLKVNVIGTSVPTGIQTVSGVLVQSGRQEGFTSYALQSSHGAAHCYSLCSALTAVCRLFAFHSQLLQCYVYDVDFYGTWTNTSTSDINWTSYYAQDTGRWKLLYKVSKGIGVDASNALFVNAGIVTASASQMAPDATCACWLKSGIVDSWSKFPITQVSLVLATAGVTVKYLNFSTTSTDTAATFFQRSKIVASSWTDLSPTTSPLLHMYIGTPAANSGGRYFLIARGYNGCSGDTGWMSVSGLGTGPCPFDIKPVPQFAYVRGTTYENLVNAAFADALLLYAKM